MSRPTTLGQPGVFSTRITSIAHSTEDVQKVVDAMMTVLPPEYREEIQTSEAKGYFGNAIVVCRLLEPGRRNAGQLFERIMDKLSRKDRSRILDELVTRLDRSGTLHLRLDKQEAFSGKVSLGDAESIKVEIHFGPSKPEESILELIRERIAGPSSEGETDL